MTENNRSQERNPGSSTQQGQSHGQNNQTQKTSNQGEQDPNPQDGRKWSNYQTREMSDEGYTGENTSSQESK